MNVKEWNTLMGWDARHLNRYKCLDCDLNWWSKCRLETLFLCCMWRGWYHFSWMNDNTFWMKEIVFVGMEIDKKAHEKKFGEIAKY
jgi:hypothetical protein